MKKTFHAGEIVQQRDSEAVGDWGISWESLDS